MLRYSLFVTACLRSLHDFFSSHSVVFLVGGDRRTRCAYAPESFWLAVMRLRSPPEAREQCPRESRQRFAERLPSSRAEDWRLHARAGYSPYYVGPNIIWIMLSSHLCWVCSRDGQFCGAAGF